MAVGHSSKEDCYNSHQVRHNVYTVLCAGSLNKAWRQMFVNQSLLGTQPEASSLQRQETEAVAHHHP
jgi:hypothetical protein